MIEVKSVYKSFDGRQILNGIDATFEEGKTNLIIGKSGSGKTVLLKCIVGLYTAEQGDILYDGRSSYNMNAMERQQLRQEIGMLFQGSALFDSLTVEENVRFPLDMFAKNMNMKQRKAYALDCLKRVELTGVGHLLPAQISGGMQKRVAIARALALEPKYLLCDEPNSGLDPVTAGLIDQLIIDITHERGITTIINTHDMNSVMQIGEHIIFINQGEKCFDGNSQNILKTDIESLNNFLKPSFGRFS